MYSSTVSGSDSKGNHMNHCLKEISSSYEYLSGMKKGKAPKEVNNKIPCFVSHSNFPCLQNYRDVDADVIIVKPNRIYSLEFGLARTCNGCTLYKYK
jgi:hypothetical protein